jgi:hypothetical protein
MIVRRDWFHLRQTGLVRRPRHIGHPFVRHIANHNCIGPRRCAFLRRHRCHLPKRLELNQRGQKTDINNQKPHIAHITGHHTKQIVPP